MENLTYLQEFQIETMNNSSNYSVVYYEPDFEFRILHAANFFELIFMILRTFGYLISIICLIIYLCKFFHRSNQKQQNLANNNVASFCFNTLMYYIIMLLLSQVYFKGFVFRFCLHLANYTTISNSLLLFVISVDTFRSLRRCVQKLCVLTGPQWKKFALYSLFGWGLPLGSFFEVIINNTDLTKAVSYGILVLRVISLILLCFSVRYIKLAMIKNGNEDSMQKELRIYWRLFLLTGILSISYCVWIFISLLSETDNLMTDMVIWLLSSFDGLFIYVTLTFKVKNERKEVPEDTQITLNTLN